MKCANCCRWFRERGAGAVPLRLWGRRFLLRLWLGIFAGAAFGREGWSVEGELRALEFHDFSGILVMAWENSFAAMSSAMLSLVDLPIHIQCLCRNAVFRTPVFLQLLISNNIISQLIPQETKQRKENQRKNNRRNTNQPTYTSCLTSCLSNSLSLCQPHIIPASRAKFLGRKKKLTRKLLPYPSPQTPHLPTTLL